MADPPSLDGGSKVTVALASPAVAVTFPGAPGVVIGVTCTESDDGPEPTALVAATVTSYKVPLASPSTAIGLPAPVLTTSLPVPVTPSGCAVTTYPLIGAPPS